MLIKKMVYTAVFVIASIAGVMALSFPKKEKSREVVRSVDLSSYSFVKSQDNAIQFYGHDQLWNALFDKLDSIAFLGKGRLDIVHIGGSHVQGGFLTDKIRNDFAGLTRGTSLPRGFFFPYKLAGSNSSSTIECRWTGKWKGQRCSVQSDSIAYGMSGFNATTTDSISSIAVITRSLDSSVYLSSKIRVYYTCTDNMQIVPDADIHVIHHEKNEKEGYTEYQVLPAIAEWRMQVVRNSPNPGQFTLQGILMDNQSSGVVYHTIGVNGASTASYLKCQNFGEQIQSMHPDLAVLAIGVNDANVPEGSFDTQAYIARYDSILTSLKEANPKICFLFITNNDTYYHKRYPNRNALEVRKAVEYLAKEHNGAVYDWFEVMGGLGSIRKWRDAGLAAGDLVHFTKAGYQLEADLFFNAFVGSFNRYLERRYGSK